MSDRPSAQELIAAIHDKCLDCSGGSRMEVHNCRIKDCPLWFYRRGKPKEKSRAEGQISVFEIAQKEEA